MDTNSALLRRAFMRTSLFAVSAPCPPASASLSPVTGGREIPIRASPTAMRGSRAETVICPAARKVSRFVSAGGRVGMRAKLNTAAPPMSVGRRAIEGGSAAGSRPARSRDPLRIQAKGVDLSGAEVALYTQDSIATADDLLYRAEAAVAARGRHLGRGHPGIVTEP